MEAIRQITQLENNLLTLCLPLSFNAKRVEVIVMPAEEEIASSQEVTGVRRRPSIKLKGTRIIGDIISPVVPEEDWDALK
jgi:F0F1-type ATP synthase alpha subunit